MTHVFDPASLTVAACLPASCCTQVTYEVYPGTGSKQITRTSTTLSTGIWYGR